VKEGTPGGQTPFPVFPFIITPGQDSHQLSPPLRCLLFSYQTQFSLNRDSFITIKHPLLTDTIKHTGTEPS